MDVGWMNGWEVGIGVKTNPRTLIISGNIYHEAMKFGTDVLCNM